LGIQVGLKESWYVCGKSKPPVPEVYYSKEYRLRSHRDSANQSNQRHMARECITKNIIKYCWSGGTRRQLGGADFSVRRKLWGGTCGCLTKVTGKTLEKRTALKNTSSLPDGEVEGHIRKQKRFGRHFRCNADGTGGRLTHTRVGGYSR